MMMMISEVTVVMVALEFLEVGMNTVNKAAMSNGLSKFVLVVYSNILAIFFLSSSSLFFYRNRTVPPLTWSIIARIFLLALLSCSGQLTTYIGIGYSSPTLASVMIDLTPAFTFILAIISRMEGLDIRTRSSQAKSIGTLALIAGGLVVTLYKGIPLIRSNAFQKDVILLSTTTSNWAIGGSLLAAHSLILAFIYIVMTWITRDFPAELVVTLISSTFVAILSAITTLFAEKDPNAWKIKPDIELVAVVYSAAFAVTLRTVIHTWACRKKGPVYTCMFKPLGMVIAALLGVSFLGDGLFLGSVIGAVIIAFGFYVVIWGKAQEERKSEDADGQKKDNGPSSKFPLLQNKDNGPV